MVNALRIVRLKNTTTSNITLLGTTFPPSTYVLINPSDVLDFAQDNETFQRIANGTIIVNKGADITEDIATPTAAWKWIEGNEILAKLNHASEVGDKKLWVHSTSKPEFDGKQFFAHWTGTSDLGSPNVGGGPVLKLVNVVGEAEQTLDLEFDSLSGDVYTYESILSWYPTDLNATNIGIGNTFEASLTSKPTEVQQFVDKHYILDGNKILMSPSGPDTGTHGFASLPSLVPNYHNGGGWDYSSSTGLVPSMNNTGYFDIFTVPVTVMKLVNNFNLCPMTTSNFVFSSGDTARIHPGYLIKIKTHNISNTNWTLELNLALFRERTV